jgi:carbon monoxide dehydrogenase subunit G
VKIEGEYIFDGPREEVWELIRDPEVLATALPGTQSLEQVSESEYEGMMHVRVGPVAGAFSGKIVVSDEVPPESCTLTVEGRGAPGFANGTGHIHLLEQEDGTTLMNYEGEIQIGGKLASVGQRLLDTASKSMIRQGLEALNNALLARIEAKAEGKEVEYAPPSEAKFAMAVAKDMAGEMLSQPQTLWAIMAIVAAVAMIVGFLLGRMSRDEA